MKAAAVLLFAAGITTAAVVPVHHSADGLAARQDVSTEVIDDASAAEAGVEVADSVDAEAEAADAGVEDVSAASVDVNDVLSSSDVDLSAISDLSTQDLLSLNLNDLVDFQLLGLDPNLLSLGITNIFDSFFPGFITVDALSVLDAGQLLELMIVAQTLFNAQAFGFINQAQLINLFTSGFIGNVLPFGFGGQVAVNLGALGFGGFGGAFSQNAFGSGLDINADDLNTDDILSGLDLSGLDLSGLDLSGLDLSGATSAVSSGASATEAAEAAEKSFTAEELADFTR